MRERVCECVSDCECVRVSETHYYNDCFHTFAAASPLS